MGVAHELPQHQQVDARSGTGSERCSNHVEGLYGEQHWSGAFDMVRDRWSWATCAA